MIFGGVVPTFYLLEAAGPKEAAGAAVCTTANVEEFERVYEMKSRNFLYVLGQAGGLLIGYMLSISGLPLFNVIFTIAVVLFVPIGIHLFAPRVHSSHLAMWEEIRKNGPMRFVGVRYVLYLGIPSSIAVFFGIAAPVESPFLHLRLMIFVACALLIGIAALGYYEWVQCEKDYSVSLMEKTANQFHPPVEGEQTS